MKDFGMPSEKTMDLLVKHFMNTSVPRIKEKLLQRDQIKKCGQSPNVSNDHKKITHYQ